MKNLFKSLKTLILLVLALTLISMGVTAYFNSMLINAASIILAIFILFLAADSFDKNNNLGKYANNN